MISTFLLQTELWKQDFKCCLELWIQVIYAAAKQDSIIQEVYINAEGRRLSFSSLIVP